MGKKVKEGQVSKGFLDLTPEKRQGVLKTAKRLLQIQRENKAVIGSDGSVSSHRSQKGTKKGRKEKENA
jgi:hypothetical protein